MRIALVLLPFLIAPALAQGLSPQQEMRLRHVSTVVPSPDGAWIAYTVLSQRGADEQPGGAKVESFVMPIDGGDPVAVPGSTGLAWRPGTSTLTYATRRGDDKVQQVYGVEVPDGIETRLSTTPNGVATYAWQPDGQGFAYTAPDPLPELRAANRARGFTADVVDEDFVHVGLWHWAGGASRRLTKGVTVNGFRWAPTGTHLAVAIAPRNLVDDSYVFTRLHVLDLASAELRPLAANPGKLGEGAWSPDGTHFAYIGAADRNDPHAGMLYVADWRQGRQWPVADGLRGAVTHVEWRQPKTLTVMFDLGVRTFVADVPAGGGELSAAGARPLPAASHFAFLGGSDRIALVGSTAAHPGEVFVENGGGELRRMTFSNPELDAVTLGDQEAVRFAARDGLEIEGIRMRPVGQEEGRRYPLVIVAHGGPEAHYQDGWLTRYSEPGQILAGMGYVVWYPNYRASTGYGVEFAKADHGDPMGREFDDHLDAIAHFAAEGLVDPARVGVIGGSYGGYTAAWAATRHSEHFAAAVSFVPFVDIRTKWLTSDIPYEFYHVHYQEKWPHEQVGFLADRSPLTFAERCRTPLLLCGGTADPRVHPSQPFMLYRAVKFATDTPVRYVQYPGEGHGNRLNVHRYDYMLRSIRWLDHYLQPGDRRGVPMPPRDLEYPRW
jgi:dipeptidyl aminopeptidase/acylaminoacyl peptidase